MKKFGQIVSVFTLLLLFSVTGCIDDNDNQPSRYLELGRFSGAVLIAKGDTIIYNKYFGLADYENVKAFSDTTAFKIGEISELITAGIVRQLAEEGKFKLSDKASKYLPEIKAKLSRNFPCDLTVSIV